MNKKIFVVAAALIVLSAGVIGIQTAFAQDSDINPVNSLVQKIADKFGLKQEDVKAVFDEHHKEMEMQMQKKQDERLDQLVKDGKITSDQKTLIINKMNELKAEHEKDFEEFKNLSKDQIKAKMEARHAELNIWAKENGIDPQYLMFHVKFNGKGIVKGMGDNHFIMVR